MRQPIVAILLLIALFTTVSGKPLDGVLMLAVATMLIFDAARSRRQTAAGGSGASPSAATLATSRAGSHQRGPRRLLARAAWLAAGALYRVVVGHFRRKPLSGEPLRRAWLWAVVLVSGGMLELASLLQQPHLTTDSCAHPTISALTDPVLASFPGRSAVLGGWLLAGWYVVSR